jgi:hypothetical protein
MGLRLECAALLELLPDPARGRHTKTKNLREVAGAFALFVEPDDSLACRQRDCSHDPALPYRSTQVKLYHLWKCSKSGDEAKRLEAIFQSGLDEVLARHPGLSREKLICAVDFAHTNWLRAQRRPPTLPPKA